MQNLNKRKEKNGEAKNDDSLPFQNQQVYATLKSFQLIVWFIFDTPADVNFIPCVKLSPNRFINNVNILGLNRTS